MMIIIIKLVEVFAVICTNLLNQIWYLLKMFSNLVFVKMFSNLVFVKMFSNLASVVALYYSCTITTYWQ